MWEAYAVLLLPIFAATPQPLTWGPKRTRSLGVPTGTGKPHEPSIETQKPPTVFLRGKRQVTRILTPKTTWKVPLTWIPFTSVPSKQPLTTTVGPPPFTGIGPVSVNPQTSGPRGKRQITKIPTAETTRKVPVSLITKIHTQPLTGIPPASKRPSKIPITSGPRRKRQILKSIDSPVMPILGNRFFIPSSTTYFPPFSTITSPFPPLSTTHIGPPIPISSTSFLSTLTLTFTPWSSSTMSTSTHNHSTSESSPITPITSPSTTTHIPITSTSFPSTVTATFTPWSTSTMSTSTHNYFTSGSPPITPVSSPSTSPRTTHRRPTSFSMLTWQPSNPPTAQAVVG